MTKKKITRKEFIAKTGKCAGGLVCTPVVLSIFQSCAGPTTGPNDDLCSSAYSATCPAHNSVFNEEGEALSGPATSPLFRYNVSLSENKSKIIFNTESSDGVEITSTCQCHGSIFDEEGEVLLGPAETPLVRYNATISNNIISIENSSESIVLSDHPALQNVGGTSSIDEIDIDSEGVLMYRKSESEILVMSRVCTHTGCGIDPFIQQSVDTDYEINLSDHPELQTVGGVSFVSDTPFNPMGLLMYRKTEEEIIVFSRVCPHAGEQTGSFEECV